MKEMVSAEAWFECSGGLGQFRRGSFTDDQAVLAKTKVPFHYQRISIHPNMQSSY